MAIILKDRDICQSSIAYYHDEFSQIKNSKMVLEPHNIEPRPVFIQYNIGHITNARKTVQEPHTSLKLDILFTHPLRIFNTTPPTLSTITTVTNSTAYTSHRGSEIPSCMCHKIVSINDFTGSLQAWSRSQPPSGFQWDITPVYTTKRSSFIPHRLHDSPHEITISTWNDIALMSCTIMDISFIRKIGVSLLDWLHSFILTSNIIILNQMDLQLIMIWIPLKKFPHSIYKAKTSYLEKELTSE